MLRPPHHERRIARHPSRGTASQLSRSGSPAESASPAETAPASAAPSSSADLRPAPLTPSEKDDLFRRFDTFISGSGPTQGSAAPSGPSR